MSGNVLKIGYGEKFSFQEAVFIHLWLNSRCESFQALAQCAYQLRITRVRAVGVHLHFAAHRGFCALEEEADVVERGIGVGLCPSRRRLPR